MTPRIWMNAMVAIFGMTASTAHATQTFCVDSVNQFDVAYAAADEENVIIQVVRGTYDMTGSHVDADSALEIDDDVTIRGGYAPGCGSRTMSAEDTVFTRPGGALRIDSSGVPIEGNGDVVLESLTVRDVPGGFSIVTETYAGADAYVSLRRIWLDQTGGLRIFRTAEVALRQSMITRSTASCALRIENTDTSVEGGYLERVSLQHLTIADSSGDGLCIGQYNSDDWSLSLMNSIIFNNDEDIVLDSGSGDEIEASVYHNTYSTLEGSPLSDAPVGSLDADPQFVNPAQGNYELGGTSTSINSGFPQANVENDRDLKGDPRRFSIAADRGALESPVGSTATTLVVTTSADSGFGSLRQALLDANQSSNFNRIEFDIGNSCGPRVLNLASDLPSVLHPVQIDGYSQPGSARNTLPSGSDGQICIILQRGAGSSATSGLAVSSSAPETTQLQVEGLGFSNFLIAGISLPAGNGHTVLGSQFGGNIGAVNLAPNGYGVRLTYKALGVQIGGPEPSDRNVFVEASEAAISLSGSLGEYASEGLVQNNYIGLAADGTTAQPNDKGMVVYGNLHRIVDNVISANGDVGIDIVGDQAADNLIDGNVFGRSAILCFPGTCERGNGSHGVRIRDGALRNTVRYNTFAYNGGDGVAIVSARSNPLTSNSFYANDGEGIDLGDDSFTPNDNDAAALPAGAGNLNQNYPVLAAAAGSEGSGSASGTLESVNGWYLIELYASNDCGSFLQLSEGRYPLGRHILEITNAPSGQNGSASFANVILQDWADPFFFDEPRWILATATRYTASPSSGGRPRETSEFGPCIPYEILDDTIFADDFDGP
ncbi:right-handed parallel beta-helix repeat-containing protein [Dokdonella sp.]|uniref:right-handed parallel beta-helix repeat-containing protein n=1 Tax=Dokdonella sp. TaxID=2291710 RepID=UPI001B5B135B|nr:right-handed parallel beta-helix repeat-containing protein [Rhodoferax sp.]